MESAAVPIPEMPTSPAILLISFVPMFLVAGGYYYMNKADPDCGTSFSWVTKAMGPQLGWIAGWAIVVADVLVMANLALARFAIVALIKVDVADERGARMIAVGSFGDAPPKGVILGSTTNKLLHLTKQPVLVVAAEEK